MAKQNLLLVDADQRSLRVLEVSLRKSGYGVVTANSAQDALEMMEFCSPDLVLCDTRLPNMDGFAFIEELRRRTGVGLDLPMIVLSSDTTVESKVRGLELGVDDYLTKPIYVKEVLARVSVVLQRKRREGMELRGQGKQRFTGSLSDIGVVDLLQTIDNSKKSGVLYLSNPEQQGGAIYFSGGNPVDAELGKLRGARAIYRALIWTEGNFEIDFRDLRREDLIQTRTQGLLMEGMRRLDEWGRLLEQLPPLDCVLAVREEQLYERLGEIPDSLNSVLRQIDGKRSLMQVVDACTEDDLEALTAVARLYFEDVVFNTGRRGPNERDRNDANDEQRGDTALPLPSYAPGVVPTPSFAPGVELLTDVVLPKAVSPLPAAPGAGVQPSGRSGALRNSLAHTDSATKVRGAEAQRSVPQLAPPARMTRVRKPHKRRKRLSLTTSPGLLSTASAKTLLYESRQERDVSDEQAQFTSSAPPAPLLLAESGAWLDTLQYKTDSRGLNPGAPARTVSSRVPPPLRRASVAPTPVLSARPANETSSRPVLVPSVRVITSQTRTATPPAPAISDRPHSVPPPSEPDTATAHESLLAKAADDARLGWATKTTAPPALKRKGLALYIAGGAVALIAVLWLWFGARGQEAGSHAAPAPQTNTVVAPPLAVQPPAAVVAAPAPPEIEPEPTPAVVAAAAATPTASTEETLAKAEQLKQQGKEKQAMALYEHAVAQTPNDSVLLSRLAFMHLNRGHNTEAVTFAARATQADPSNSEGWIVLGAARDALGDRKAAKEAYRSCADQGRGSYVTECKRMLR
ncbi:MAG: hypothetical protein RL701_6040 [Pseudomonadota bacterium]